MLTVQTPLVTPDFALNDTIVVLAGVVLGGMNRPIPATLGGFVIGFASGILGGALPTNQSQYLPTFLFVAVILVLLVRPRGLFDFRRTWSAYEVPRRAAGARRAGGARRRCGAARHCRLPVHPDVLHRRARQGRDRRRALRLHRQLGRRSRSATSASSRSVPGPPACSPSRSSEKPAIMPNLAHFLPIAPSGTSRHSCSPPLVGGIFALVVGTPLMRLSGLAAGIATFGVLEITHNLLRYEEKIGPGLNAFSSVPETTGLGQAAIGALVAVLIAFVYARSRFGRLLRATREDAAAARAIGASIHVQRLIAFTLSGVLAGLAGGLYVHLLPIQTESVYLDLTFITLAMLVVGGASSLFGAVVGALSVSALDSYLAVAENGSSFLGWHIDLPTGTREIVVGVLMAAVLILKPSGITGGREFRFIRRRA